MKTLDKEIRCIDNSEEFRYINNNDEYCKEIAYIHKRNYDSKEFRYIDNSDGD